VRKELIGFVLGVLVLVVSPAPAKAGYVVQACDEQYWNTFQDGEYTFQECATDNPWTYHWEYVPLDSGILPPLSIEDAQTIAAASFVVLATVWGIGAIARVLKT